MCRGSDVAKAASFTYIIMRGRRRKSIRKGGGREEVEEEVVAVSLGLECTSCEGGGVCEEDRGVHT